MGDVKVLKFGGTSVGTIEKIKEISSYLKDRIEENDEKLIVVVSAMGKTTDELLKRVNDITSNPDVRELDTLLAIGEQNTISLMSIALNDIGVRARSLTGMQAGIKTFGQHTKSKIEGINKTYIKSQLEKFDVLVVAGFQGYNEDMEITTLGRGGSDTTAVGISASLGVSCEIYTDVIGVFGTDPRIYPDAKKINYISYEEMLELSALGAGVLETRCVEIANNFNVDLYIGKTLSKTKGTWIMASTDLIEKKVVTGVALDEDILHVSLSSEKTSVDFVQSIFDELDRYSVNIDMISQILSGDKLSISFTCKDTDRNFLNKIIDDLKNRDEKLEVDIVEDRAKVSIVGSGMRDVSGVAARAFRLLCSNDVKFYQVTTSEISISYVVEKKVAKETVKLLCEEFNI